MSLPYPSLGETCGLHPWPERRIGVSFQPEFWVLRDVIPLKLKRHFLSSKITTPPKAGEKNLLFFFTQAIMVR
jgi:hypothetical protein